MSFSSETKSELARLNLDKKCCRAVALATFLEAGGEFVEKRNKLSFVFSSENAAVARKIFKLSKELLGCKPVISVSRRKNFRKNNVYSVRIPADREVREAVSHMVVSVEDNPLPQCCSRVFLRFVFLAAGSVINPQRTYHLEITTPKEVNAERIAGVMGSFGLKPGISRRKQWYVIYLKDADQISDFLNIIGAHTALLNLESIRTIKGMRNKVNRLINCETANINKSINASLRQIKNINLIKRTIGLNCLPENLSEVAVLRLEHPDATLKELGEMLDPPVGKSGVNHRMRKIEKIAEKLEGRI